MCSSKFNIENFLSLSLTFLSFLLGCRASPHERVVVYLCLSSLLMLLVFSIIINFLKILCAKCGFYNATLIFHRLNEFKYIEIL